MHRIVFKSCKLIVVMAGSTVIAGKIYSLFEYFVALSLVAGMILFSLGDMRGGVNWLHGDNAKLMFGKQILKSTPYSGFIWHGILEYQLLRIFVRHCGAAAGAGLRFGAGQLAREGAKGQGVRRVFTHVRAICGVCPPAPCLDVGLWRATRRHLALLAGPASLLSSPRLVCQLHGRYARARERESLLGTILHGWAWLLHRLLP
jgi:hypothetical protein